MLLDENTQRKLLRNYKKEVFVKDLLEKGDLLMPIDEQPFVLELKNKHKTSEGLPFYRLELSDRTGKIGARVWPDVLDRINIDQLSEGDIVLISGELNEYNNKRYIKVTQMTLLHDNQVNIADLTNSVSVEELEAMYNRVLDIIKDMKNKYFRELLNNLLVKDKAVANAFRNSVAGERVHHDYIGGLLEHTLEMYDVAQSLIKHYPQADPDLVTAGVFLHDIGKIIEYDTKRTKAIRTKKGYLLGHIFLGIELISQHLPEGFPEEYKIQLYHIILAHHGQMEYGSPVVPATIEAIIVAEADDASSKIRQYQKEIVNKSPDEQGFGEYQKYIRTKVYFSHLGRQKMSEDS